MVSERFFFDEDPPEVDPQGLAIVAMAGDIKTSDISSETQSNASLTKQSTSTASTSSSSECFVATATYGSPMAVEVIRFRSFRDNYLLRYNWGRKATRAYYIFGPWLARLVKQSRLCKLVSIKILGWLLSKLP
jgi:hypothetical protein